MRDIAITPIVDEDCFEIALQHLFPTAQAERLRAEAYWLAPDHIDPTLAMVRLGMRSWLVRSGGLTILVDTCIGQHKPRPRHAAWHMRESDQLLGELAAAGLRPADIDVVMCTHLHADHVGWNTRLENGRWVPTFPNARYALSRIELDHWGAMQADTGEAVNHGSFDDSVLPVVAAGQALYVGAGDEILSGMTIEGLPGHTIDHLGLRVRRLEGDALFCGDAIHSPLQLVCPDWASAFCADAEQATATRAAMLARAADDGTELFPAHFRNMQSLRLKRAAGSYRPA